MFAVINTEIQARELPANLLLAAYFAQTGGTSIILDQSTLPEVLPRLPRNGIFHAKSLESSKIRAKQHDDLILKGYSITAQDQEHGLLVEDYDLTLRQRFTSETLSRVSRYFGWGPLDSESLKRKFPESQDKIIEAGSPRLDIARRGSLPEPPMDANRSQILFVSSIESHSPTRYWEILRNMKKLSETIRAPELVDQRFSYWASEIRSIPKILKLFSIICEELPGTPVVVRPHFSEDSSAWEYLTEEYPSIKVDSSTAVNDAVSRSLVTLHYGSTVAIESLLSGVPPIALPLASGFENTLTPFANRVSLRPESFEEVVENIKKIQTGSSPALAEQRALLGSRFRIEGPPASALISTEWLRMSQAKDEGQISERDIRAIKKALKLSDRRISQKASKVAVSGLQQSAQQKFPPLTAEKVHSLMNSLVQNHNLKRPNLILLSSRAILVLP